MAVQHTTTHAGHACTPCVCAIDVMDSVADLDFDDADAIAAADRASADTVWVTPADAAIAESKEEKATTKPTRPRTRHMYLKRLGPAHAAATAPADQPPPPVVVPHTLAVARPPPPPSARPVGVQAPARTGRMYTPGRQRPVDVGALSTTLVNDALVVETAMQAYTRMVASGEAKSAVPTCSAVDGCEGSAVVVSDAQYVCSNCGLVLGIAYDERPLRVHDDDPHDEGGRVHAHIDSQTKRYVMLADGTRGCITTADVEGTRVSGGDRAELTASARRANDAIAKVERRHDWIGSVIKDNIAATMGEAMRAIHAIGMAGNEPLALRCEELVVGFLTRCDAPEVRRKSCMRIAIGCLTRACAEAGLGFRRTDMIRATRIDPSQFARPAEFAAALANTLHLPPIDRGAVTRGFLLRYTHEVKGVSRLERMRIDALFSWTRWVVDTLEFVPAPLADGTPYVGTEAAVAMGTSHAKRPRSVAMRSRRTGKYQWVEQLTDMLIAAPGVLSSDNHKAFWDARMKPVIRSAIRYEGGAPVPIVPATEAQEWTIRRRAPSTLAAAILWLVTQLRCAIPRESCVFKRGHKVTPARTPGKRRRIGPSSEAASTAATAAAIAATAPPSVYRLTQREVCRISNVNPVTIKRAKQAIFDTWATTM